MPAGTSFNQRPICLCHYLRAVDLLRPAVHRDEGYTWLRELQTLVRMLTGVTVRELKSDAFKKSANNSMPIKQKGQVPEELESIHAHTETIL